MEELIDSAVDDDFGLGRRSRNVVARRARAATDQAANSRESLRRETGSATPD